MSQLQKRRLISSGSSFERDIRFSRAVAHGDWVFVSGTTGFDYSSMTIPDGLVAQTEQCLRNIAHADEFPQCWPILRKYFGEMRPAAMMISAGLADPRMRI